MSNGVQVLMADRYLRRFIIAERLSLGLGYPKRAAFASDVRGSLGSPPPTGVDPYHDAIGRFYQSIQTLDRTILEYYYTPASRVREFARRIGTSYRTVYRRIKRLIADCAHWLEGMGYL